MSNLLLFRLPEISQRYDDPTEFVKETTSINGLLKNYQFGTIGRDDLLAQAEPHFDAIASMKGIRPIYSGIERYRSLLQLQSRLILHGPGGMGKSEYLYQISQKLDEEKIAHLTLYGKYVRTIQEIPFREIERRAKNSRFVFIFDALNEMEDGQAALLLAHFKKIQNPGNLFLIVSYRDGYFSESPLWNDAGFQEYPFAGVDYHSALSSLLTHHPKLFFAYSDVLESNNALFLNALLKMIDDRSENAVREGSVSTMTTLLEHLVEQESKEGWYLVKAMAEAMAEKGRKFLRESEISALSYRQQDKRAIHLAALLASGFLIRFRHEGDDCYSFGVERLGDFLLTRHLMRINPWDSKIIREKARALRLDREALLLMIWDKSGQNAGLFFRKLQEIVPGLNCDLPSIRLMSWTPESIHDFQAHALTPDLWGCFVQLAGVRGKPFNCTNFLDAIFSADPQKYLDVVKSFYLGMESTFAIERRLQNILATIENCGQYHSEMEEYFLFAFWCLGLGDRQSVLLAEKILLEIATFDPPHASALIKRYRENGNIFIQEKIIDILAHLDHSFADLVSPLFQELLSSKDYLHAENEARMSHFLRSRGLAPNGEKFNVVEVVKRCGSSSVFIDQVRQASMLIDRDFLRIDFQFDDHNRSDFLDYPLEQILKANRHLKKLHPCYNANGCRLFGTFESEGGKEVGIDSEHCLNNHWILLAIAYFYERISQTYEPNTDERSYGVSSLEDSFDARCLLLAQNQAYGSLMNHYVTNDFYADDGDGRFRGFVPFNPLRFQGDGDDLWGSFPLFDPLASKIRGILEERVRRVGWDGIVSRLGRKLGINVIEEVAKPIEIREYHDAFLPFALTFRHEGESKKCFDGFSQWKEDCSFYGAYRSNQTIHGRRTDRFLSIEMTDYWGSLRDYPLLKKAGSLCCLVPSFGGRGMNLPSASIVLPPAAIVRKLALKFHSEDGTWRRGNEVVFISDDGESSYYRNVVSQCLLISRKAYRELQGDRTLSFFGYFEQFTPVQKGTKRTEFHFQLKKGKMTKITANTSRDNLEKPRLRRCLRCPRYHESRKKTPLVLPSFLAKAIESYQGGSKK